MLRVRSDINPAVARMAQRMFEMPPEATSELLTLVDAEFQKNIGKNFSTQGVSGGAEFKSLSPEYKAWKDRLFSGAAAQIRRIAKSRGQKRVSIKKALRSENKILQLTGDMKRAFSTAQSGSTYLGQAWSHIAEVARRGSAIVFTMGATGPDYFSRPPSEQRNPIQHTSAQVEGYGRSFAGRCLSSYPSG